MEIRSRLNTAETAQIQNFTASANPPQQQRRELPWREISENQDGQDTADDMTSVISSLSNDDSRVLASFPPAMPVLNKPAYARDHQRLPPLEVSFPAREGGQKFLSIDTTVVSTTSDPPLTGKSSAAAVVRPTLGRFQSCPLASMDFSVASTTPSATPSSSTLRTSSTQNMEELIQELSIQPSSLAVTKTARLLGGRKKRTHRRGHSANSASLGSIVGMSSLAPTESFSSYTESEGSQLRTTKTAVKAQRKLAELTGAKDGAACCVTNIEEKFRKRNIVAEELKHVFKAVVKSPLKVVKKGDEPQPDLSRSSGFLT